MKLDPFRDGPLLVAVRKMFNAEPEAGLAALRAYVKEVPCDPLGHSLSAVAPFYHFAGNRLRPSNGKSPQDTILSKGTGVPGDIDQIRAALSRARRLAKSALEANPLDQNALVALCMTEGVERDILFLAERRWVTSLEYAKAASAYARRLIEVNPKAYDAYYNIGLSEYALSCMPGLLRGVTKIPGIVGQVPRAIQFLEAAASQGWYFRDFARQMLVTIYLDRRKPQEAQRILEVLANEFDGNPAYRRQLEKLRAGETLRT